MSRHTVAGSVINEGGAVLHKYTYGNIPPLPSFLIIYMSGVSRHILRPA